MGRSMTWEGREYVFCSKGCFLEFRDDPAKYLAADYRPSM
jgi:YHS domain-containing protein